MSAGTHCFSGPCLDDVLHDVLRALLESGQHITASRGSNREITGVMLLLDNPLARLSRTETRGRLFSALGEFCWYLSGSDQLTAIEYYVSEYRKDAIDGVLPGAYGPRLVGGRDGNQLDRVISLLRERPTSRRAVIRLFDAVDVQADQRDVPCTCTLQYLNRGGELDAVTYMRSNDVYWGLPHDVFCFTMLQEYIARILGVELGSYKHVVGSLHIYEEREKGAHEFLNEGFQSTEHPMPSMPFTAPMRSLSLLLSAEGELREPSVDWLRVNRFESDMDPYWADLVRLLHSYRLFKDSGDDPGAAAMSLERVKEEMESDVYSPFIDRLIGRLRDE